MKGLLTFAIPGCARRGGRSGRSASLPGRPSVPRPPSDSRWSVRGRRLVWGSVTAAFLAGAGFCGDVRGQDARAAVDAAVDRLVQLATSDGRGETRPAPVPPGRDGAIDPGVVGPPPGVDPATKRKQIGALLLGRGDRRFWGTSSDTNAFDLRFGPDGKGWIYRRKLGPEGQAESDEEPVALTWELVGDNEPKLHLTMLQSSRAEYAIDAPAGALVWRRSDPAWSGFRRLELRAVSFGFYGSAFTEWNLP
jgi:hypothetical protein